MATQVSLTLKTPWQLIVDEINKLNTDTGANFKYTDLKYVLKSKSDSAPDATLTLSPGEGTPYFNNRDVTYHRLDLAKWFQKIAVRVNVTADTTIGDVVDLVAQRYGMITPTGEKFLDKDKDIKADTLSNPVTFNEHGIQTITLEAKEDSLAWYGSVQVKVYNTTLDLANIIKVTNLGNLTYVDEGDGTKTSARLLTYPLDFSTYTAGLQGITNNETKINESLAGNLTTLIKEQTGVSDEIITELKANLQTATFVYNGATTSSTDNGVNATYNHVLVLSLANGTHTYGKAVFGYNTAD
ncbi:hypothetical protein Goslar_00022 [Escherichia phage vB_EcoM_Goslar]|uniref:Uncharacterized protein n=1 Tax=Escherichia phage vB_EcoM_Goslar TaxID=2502409 RepID=A0A482GMV3_BPGOS|nr:virion structural protein [Escherichia phage vB_EcoM_Goslar]QBO63815.1 hypothetical protein Goslar_00022 [Escherichia phage vB_EcoM_Goslar]